MKTFSLSLSPILRVYLQYITFYDHNIYSLPSEYLMGSSTTIYDSPVSTAQITYFHPLHKHLESFILY